MLKNSKLIAQGAEARLYQKDKILIKDRIKKSYRIEEIDNNLRKSRTRRESKVLKKLEILNFPSPRHFTRILEPPNLCSTTPKLWLFQGSFILEISACSRAALSSAVNGFLNFLCGGIYSSKSEDVYKVMLNSYV